MLKQLLIPLLCLATCQLSYAGCDLSNSYGYHTCLLITSKDAGIATHLSLKIHNTLDFTAKQETPDPDLVYDDIAPHSTQADAYSDTDSWGVDDENGNLHTFNYLKVNFSAVFLAGQKFPLTNCQVAITSQTLPNYVGQEVKTTFSKSDGKIMCRVTIEPITDCKDTSIASLADFDKEMSFEKKRGLCLAIKNATDEPLDFADVELHSSSDESADVSVTREIPFEKDFSLGLMTMSDDPLQASSDVVLTMDYSGAPVGSCQLHLDQSNAKQFNNKLIEFQVAKSGDGYTYTCTKVIKDLPQVAFKRAQSFKSQAKHKPHAHFKIKRVRDVFLPGLHNLKRK